MGYMEIGPDRFASFDPSVSRTRIRNYEQVPSWQSIYIRLLQRGDYQSAALVKGRNEPDRDLIAVRDSQAVLLTAIDNIRRAA